MGEASSVPPQIFVVDGFVIEAYTTIRDVPYATISEHRGKATDQEREDELYGRCRICVMNKNENLLLCDECDRAFHMSCLVPMMRDIPKGEWLCPRCETERLHHHHTCAAAVVMLRNVLLDIESRASLPLKVQLKMLDVPRPNVTFGRAVTPPVPVEEAQFDAGGNVLHAHKRRLSTLPPKYRAKIKTTASLEEQRRLQEEARGRVENDGTGGTVHDGDGGGSSSSGGDNGNTTTVMYKRVDEHVAQKRLRNLVGITEGLQPLVNRLSDQSVPAKFQRLRRQLGASARRQTVGRSVTLLNVGDVARSGNGDDEISADVDGASRGVGARRGRGMGGVSEGCLQKSRRLADGRKFITGLSGVRTDCNNG